MSNHVKYAASAMARTILCSASVGAIAALPASARQSGEAADRGTRIHKWYEMYMTGAYSKDSKKAKGQDKEEAAIAAAAGLATKKIAAELGFPAASLKSEKFFTLGSVHPECGGTSDIHAVVPFGDLLVVDLKAGQNYVDAEMNYQGLVYLASVYESLDPLTQFGIKNCHFVIVQPAQTAPYECRVQVWTITKEEMITLLQVIKKAVNEAETNPQFRPGEHCRDKYCDARTTCSAYIEWANQKSLGALAHAMEGTVLTPPDKATDPQWAARIASLLAAEPFITDLIKEAKKQALQALTLDPNAVPGYGISTGVGHRKWTDEKAVEAELKAMKLKLDVYAPREILSPSQLEKVMAVKELPEKLQALVIQPSTAPSVKPVKQDNFQAFLPTQPDLSALIG